MAICAQPGCTEHYGCRLRAKGIQVAAAALPNHFNDPRHRPWRPMAEPGWMETTPFVDHRADGSAMPILRADGTTANMKDLAENRHGFTEHLRAMNTDRS